MDKILIATTELIFRNTIYTPFDVLPTDDTGWIDAWLKAGSAKWVDEIPEKLKKRPQNSGQPGLTGIAHPSISPDEDMVGRVPDRYKRGAVKEPAKKPKKSRK